MVVSRQCHEHKRCLTDNSFTLLLLKNLIVQCVHAGDNNASANIKEKSENG